MAVSERGLISVWRRRISTPRRLLRAAVVAAVGLGLVQANAQPATAAVQATFYVSPGGSGWACSPAQPCSLGAAQSQVRALTGSTMTGDVVVNLLEGTYQLPSEGLRFTSADSGNNGHTVIYQAVTGQSVVFSGGRTIKDWQPCTTFECTSGLGIWKAPVPVGFDSRQLYVDGRRASVASQAVTSVFAGMVRTPTGYTYSYDPSSTIPDPSTWSEADRVDFVYGPSAQNGMWRYSGCSVAGISSGSVTMADPCWSNASTAPTGFSDNWVPNVNKPTSIENNLALLTSPGQFYVDPTWGVIYYIPRDNEDLTKVTTVAAGVEKLLNVDNARNLRFSGITFSYAGWLPYHLDGNGRSQGLLDMQANVLFTTGLTYKTMQAMPAAVTCHTCSHVTFSDDVFTHLGASAVAVNGSGTSNAVSGNIVTDVSGNGIQVGDVDDTTLESSDAVTNNYVHDVATEYLGGVGIFAGYVTYTTIAHNEIWNVPYTGISLGWGWGGWGLSDPAHPAQMANNHIDDNSVHDVMTASPLDGGAIYVNGTQFAAGTIRGNYIAHTSRGAGIYLDNGSTYWQVTHNVADGWDPVWLNVQYGSGYISCPTTDCMPSAPYNTAQYNCASALAGKVNLTAQQQATLQENFSGNTEGVSSWSQQCPDAVNTLANAGLDSEHLGLRGGPAIASLGYLATTYATPSFSGYEKDNANDGGRGDRPYASTISGDPGAFWQVDLGARHDLSDIQVLFRQDYDLPAERANFEIWVSNHGDMSQGHTVACRQGSTPLAFQARYDCPAPAGQWRYVAVVKTDAAELVLRQVRVFGAVDSNLAPSGTAYASSEYSVNTAAPRAIDGNTSSIFATRADDTNGWWEVDLGARYTTSIAQVVFRSDGYDYPTERENFQVWVSNTPDMSQGKTVACSIGTTPLPLAGTYTCALPGGPWRYVAVKKTDTNELVLSEVRIYGH